MCVSVTVSIAEETMGIVSLMVLEKKLLVSTSLGKMSERAGTNRTSSNVSASLRNFMGFEADFGLGMVFIVTSQTCVLSITEWVGEEVR
jgi:hypothetical protein